MYQKNKIIIAVVISLILALTLVLGVFLFRPKTAEKIIQNQKSEVKIVNGKPKLYVGSKELSTASTQLYYIPELRAAKDVPAYTSSDWVSRMEKVIDNAKDNDARIVIPEIWWSDIDKSAARSANPESNYDFGSLDKVMGYAKDKGVYIMISLSLHRYAPEWWLKENNFPPLFNKAKTCDFCETDSYGNVYDNPSMGSDVTEKDFGTFLKAVINRYKNHPALIGWATGIGATGEDNYGPNYLAIKGNAGGIGDIERKPLMFTDYSPFFQREFKKWLKNKYKTDAALQAAWKNNTTTLEKVAVPPAKDLIIDTDKWIGLFPEESQGWLSGDMNNLTEKGKDFYEFRTYMANNNRNFYVNLFKSTDPDHVLIFNSGGSVVAMEDSRIDGIIRNDNLCFDCPVSKFREDQYSGIISSIENENKYKKLSFFGFENGSAQQTKTESSDHLAYITAVGKGVKCAGGIFGYVSDLATRGTSMYPSWSSASSQKAVSEVTKYTPGMDCSCQIVKDLWQKASCDSAQSKDGCQLISKAYGDYCHVSVPEKKTITPQNNQTPTTNSQTEKCGDGTCDDIEKSSKMCLIDCK